MNEEFSVVFKEATAALKEAVSQYGPDAVELGLSIYQLFAIKELVFAFLLCLIPFLLYKLFIRILDWTDDMNEFERTPVRAICGGLFVVFGAITLAVATHSLVNPFLWVAAFGHPEYYIAYKALITAGLL